MSDVPGQKLREIIEEYGQAVCDDARRCEALLKDLCPEYKRESKSSWPPKRRGSLQNW